MLYLQLDPYTLQTFFNKEATEAIVNYKPS